MSETEARAERIERMRRVLDEDRDARKDAYLTEMRLKAMEEGYDDLSPERVRKLYLSGAIEVDEFERRIDGILRRNDRRDTNG